MRAPIPDCEARVPASLVEALGILASEPGSWIPMAGGTDLMVLLQAGRLKGGRFLDLSRIEELRGISEDGEGLRLGALTTFSELLECSAVREHYPNLARSARATGALAIQNRGTLGGNIANASPAADSSPSLLAYGAELELVSTRGRRRVPYEAFHLGYKRMDLAPDELLAGIRVPRPAEAGFHFHRKVGTRRAQALSKLCLAAYARIQEGRVAEIRVGLGSVAPVPLRARGAEAVILGSPVAALPAEAALEALMADISPMDDIRSTAHYRRVVTGNVFRQMLGELASV